MSDNRITRRQFLFFGVLWLTGMGLSIYSFLEDSGEELIEDRILDVLTSPPIFDPFPQGFNYKSFDNVCYVTVHPGHSLSNLQNLDDKYGSYQTYLENIKQFLEYLRNSRKLAIFAINSKTLYDQSHEDGLSPPDSALKVVTITNSGLIKRFIKTPNGIKEQRMSKIYSFLRGNGIHEVRFAGELSWYQDKIFNYRYLGYGCLGAIAKMFYENGFDIRGVEGCIYPTVPPKREIGVSEKLYDNMVSPM